MKPTETELTLAALLADPLTQAVMRSDNITLADTTRAFDEAEQAVSQGAGTRAAWRLARHPPYRRM